MGRITGATIAKRLNLRTGSKVLIRRRPYLSDDHPTELPTSYIPWDLAKGTPMVEENPGPGGVYARIEEAGHRLDHFDEEITARMPTPEEAKASGWPPARQYSRWSAPPSTPTADRSRSATR